MSFELGWVQHSIKEKSRTTSHPVPPLPITKALRDCNLILIYYSSVSKSLINWMKEHSYGVNLPVNLTTSKLQ